MMHYWRRWRLVLLDLFGELDFHCWLYGFCDERILRYPFYWCPTRRIIDKGMLQQALADSSRESSHKWQSLVIIGDSFLFTAVLRKEREWLDDPWV